MKLDDFFAAYFHEDWALDDATADDVVARFLREAQLDQVSRNEIASAIRTFIARFDDDAKLDDALFRDLGAYYLPRADGISARAWLERVADQVQGKLT